jgi:hypothetical protein
MATVKQAIRENDAVELLDPVAKVDAGGKWPAGTVGAVVSERGEWKLVEIANERGVTLDYVSVSAARLALRD